MIGREKCCIIVSEKEGYPRETETEESAQGAPGDHIGRNVAGIVPIVAGWQLSQDHQGKMEWNGMMLFAAVGLAAVIWMAVKRGKTRQFSKITLSQGIALGYFLWVLLSAFFGSWADAVNNQGQPAVWFGALRYEGGLTQLCYGLVFLTMTLAAVEHKPFFNAVAGSLILYCAIVAIQYTGANPLGLFPPGLGFPGFFEFQGTLGNTNMVSAYLSMVIPLLTVGYVLYDGGFWLGAALAGTVLMACVEVQSGMLALIFLMALLVAVILCAPALRHRAVTALTGLAAAVLLRRAVGLPWYDDGVSGLRFLRLLWVPAALAAGYGADRLLSRWKGQWKLWVLGLAAGILLISALAAVAFLPVPQEAEGLWELHEVLCGRPQDHFGSWRLGLWRYTLELSQESPIFGTGPDAFYYAMQDYMGSHGIALREVFDSPHNLFLGVLAGSGWPALLLYMAMLARSLQNAWRLRKDPVMLPCAAAICCYLVQGMFTFSICLISPMFFALLGMACREVTDEA